jgi:hypothetical protein
MAPVDISVEEIGHFAFFHDRFRESLVAGGLAVAAAGRLEGGAWTPSLRASMAL